MGNVLPRLFPLLLLSLAFVPPSLASDLWLVEVGPPHDAARLEALAARGLAVVHRDPEVVLGTMPATPAARAMAGVRFLDPIAAGRDHYLLRPRHAGALLPAGVKAIARYGESVLVALAMPEVRDAMAEFHPVRVFLRPLPLLPRSVPIPETALAADPVILGIVNGITQADYQAIHLDIYTNDGYPNREATSAGGANAEDKIKNLFLSYGFTDVTTPDVPFFSTNNVVARLPGSTTPDVIYVIGGHYDTVSNSPGADDNGSGTAGVLHAAKVIGQAYQAGTRFDATLIFIAFTAEEWGLYGSDAWATWASNQGLDIRGMLNMDMIGYRQAGDAADIDTVADSQAASRAIQDLVAQVIVDYVPGHATIEQNNCSVGNQSDHYSFWQQGYPAIFLFEDCFDYSPYIHTSGDTIGQSLNDFPFAVDNTKTATATLLTLAGIASGQAPPTAAFSAAPLTGQAPLTVAFTDQSAGTINAWDWTFGDGGTSTTQSPTHLYGAAGVYDVCLTVTGPGGSDQECKAGYVNVTPPSTTRPFELVTGTGPGPSNLPEVRVWSASAAQVGSFVAFATSGYGADVASGSFDSDVEGETVAGPGPHPVFGPHVRGFEALGAPVSKVSFYAYGTLRFGANVALGDVDGDAIAEIGTGAGPGAVFGPHVRGFDFDGGTLGPIPGLSFYAYATLRWGVNLALGSVDGATSAEIVTGPGPSSVFGSQVRGFRHAGGAVQPMAAVNTMAFPGYVYGAVVATGDLDGDAAAEILVGPGPSSAYTQEVVGLDLAGASLARIIDHPAGTTPYGVRLAAGDLDGDAAHEFATVQGPDPASTAFVRGWAYDAGAVTSITTFAFSPYPLTHGARLASADLGSY